MNKKEGDQHCTACGKDKALVTKVFVTKSNKFRAKFKCDACENMFEVTVCGRNWLQYNYPTKIVTGKIRHIVVQLNKEVQSLNELSRKQES